MLVLAVWMPAWHDLDVKFFDWLATSREAALSTDIALVDIRSWDVADIPGDRRTIAAFLDTLATSGQKPRAVALDISFGPCLSKPCDANWASARAALVGALRKASIAGIDVYATEEVPVDATDDVIGPPPPHDSAIYAQLKGAAHTGFTVVPGSSFLFYRVCYPASNGLDHDLWSMATQLLPGFDPTQACDTEHRPVLVGPAIDTAPPTFYQIDKSGPFPKGAELAGKYVIVGTMRFDRPSYSDRSGPELLAWALTDELALAQSAVSLQGYYQAKPQNGMLLFLIPLFSAIVVLAFTAVYFTARRLKLRSARRFLPWLASFVAFVAGTIVFGAFEVWMLFSHEIQPQVTLISIGMLLAAILCAVRAEQIQFDESATIEIPQTEKYDYDVFISYAHEEGPWVFEHVYAPLRDAKTADGRSLSIFFDTSTIRVGSAWQDKIALAIDASRFVVAVYSDIYFQKPYCRFEIRRAHRKWIGAGEQPRCVLPVMRGHPVILQAVDDIQAKSVDDDPDVVAKVVAEIVETLSQRA
jgi:TIR domain/CHASE2 domain